MSGRSALGSAGTAGEELVKLMDAGATPTTLEVCKGLATMALEELGLRLNLRPAQCAIVLGEILHRVVADRRQVALGRLRDGTYNEAIRKEFNQVAAAGELLEIGDEETFGRMRLVRLSQMSAKWEDLLRVKDNQGPAGMRGLRAALWLGRRNARTVRRLKSELAGTLESAIKAYLANGEVVKEYRDRLLVKASGSGSSDEALVLSPAPGGMEEGAAVAELQTLLPWFNDADAYRMALTLDFDPKLISFVGANLPGDSSTAKEACRILSVDPALFFASIAPEGNAVETIGSQTVRNIESLASEYPRSVEALKVLAFTHHENIPIEFLTSYFLGVPFVKKKDLYHARMVLDQVVGPLLERGFLCFHHCMIRVNPLAQVIWRSHFGGDPATLSDKLLAFVSLRPASGLEMLADGWSPAAVAGRSVCRAVMSVRLKDRINFRASIASMGNLSGAEYSLIAGELWSRIIVREIYVKIMHGYVKGDHKFFPLKSSEDLGDDLQSIDWMAFVASFSGAKFEAASGLYVRLMENGELLKGLNVSMVRCLNILNSNIMVDRVDTRLGALKISSVFPGVTAFSSVKAEDPLEHDLK